MKLVLSYILYKVGDILSHLLKYDITIDIIYPAYKWSMLTSFKLDKNDKIWKIPEE